MKSLVCEFFNLYCVVKGRLDLKIWKKVIDLIINNVLFFEMIIKLYIIYCKEVIVVLFYN